MQAGSGRSRGLSTRSLTAVKPIPMANCGHRDGLQSVAVFDRDAGFDVVEFIKRFVPQLAESIKRTAGETSVFSLFD